MSKYLLIIIFFLSSNSIAFAQSDTAQATKYFKLMMTKVGSDSLEAVNDAQKAISFARKGGSEKIEANVLNNLGVFYNIQGAPSKSDSLLKVALRIRQKIKDSVGIAGTYMSFGHNNYDQSNFKPALDYYLKAADIRGKISDKKGLSGSFIWIGNVYYIGLANYLKSIEYYKKAEAIAEELKDEGTLSFIYNDLGNVYKDLKDYKKAIFYYNKGLVINKKLGNQRGIGAIYSNLATILFDRKEYDSAIAYNQRSLKIREGQNDKKGMAISYVNIANIYILQNKNPDETKKLLDKALKIATEINFKEGIENVNNSYSTFYQNKGDYKTALLYFKKHIAIKDSMLNETMARQVNELQTKYETTAKEQRIAILNNENTLQKLSINKRNTIIGIIIGMFLLSLLLIGLFYNRYKLKQEAALQAEINKQQDIAAKGIIEAEEKERKRIAGDLHDGIGQLLSAVKMNFETLTEKYLLKQPEANQLAEKTMAMVDESCTEVRSIAHQMMPNALIKSGLVSALRDFINKIPSDKLKISVETQGINERLEGNTETVLYRVIQESVNNVIKHSGATMLDILLLSDKNEITVSIEDNGKGFDISQRDKFAGIGLKNMVSRIEFLKGTVDISSAPGKGTLVAIHIPLA